MKTYVGLSRDHSCSMRSIARAAARDYNSKISSIREASLANNQDTIVSVVECGYGNTDRVRRAITNSSISTLQPLTEHAYVADGRGTPLWDSVGELIEMFESTPDANDKDVSFLVMAITDGEENTSKEYTNAQIKELISHQESVYNWTFNFIGANIDSFEEGNSRGVKAMNSANYSATCDGVVNMFDGLSNYTLSYRNSTCDVDTDLSAFIKK
jgi:hypothetical protein